MRMRNILTIAVVFSLGAGYVACGSQSNGPPDGFGGDGGSEASSGSGGGSGSSGGGSGGSSGGTSSGSSGGSGGGSGGASGSSSGGACTTNNGPITGTVGASGGSVSRLVFGVVGDTRPPSEDDPSGYPTSIITPIFQDIEAMTPRPVLVLGTGDYQFSSTSDNSDADEQIQDYMGARASYSGAFFPAMGNHECGTANGACSSDFANCSGTTTANLSAFLSGMMQPIGQSKPYYSVNVNATDNSWTAKFVMTAANAWDSTQQSWLQGVLAQKTTYTFVVRHEPSDTSPVDSCGSCTSTDLSCIAPGVGPIDALLTQYPYTMLFVGHTHNYGHYTSYLSGTIACGSNCPPATREVVVGNGGAPITGSSTYGYVVAAQRCDGAMVVDEYNYMTNATDSHFHFVITADGTITQ